MSEPFVAEIRIFAGSFAPRGWAVCNGQLLPIAQNTALFSLIGTIYGGDGETTTALPDLQGRAPMHPGRGPGLTSRRIGQRGGTEEIELTESQMPQHTHVPWGANTPLGQVQSPTSQTTLGRVRGGTAYQAEPLSDLVDLAPESLSTEGGSQAHNNMQPFLAIHFIIALIGLYPTR
jgi:microcystin-dependent protein